MSEYQYYEFRAIDRPLTAKEQDALRACSSRARITATGFVNDYSYGDLRGDPDAWMEKYFDAFVYLANWGTHVFQVRLPGSALDAKTARKYCDGHCASVRSRGGRTILSFRSESEEGEGRVHGEGVLSSLLGVRDGLARGDLRALYLGWLLELQSGELKDDALEPPVPPGLGRLDGPLRRLADFLRIDAELLRIAAKNGGAPAPGPDRDAARRWAAALPARDKDALLARVLLDEKPAALARLRARFRKETAPAARPAAHRRTAGELRQACGWEPGDDEDGVYG